MLNLIESDVVSANYEGGYRIAITFDDEKKGVVDFSEYLSKGGVFDRFRDMDFFKDFRVNDELGALAWRHDIDIAPEKLYSKATGGPLPEWMEA
ncbi:MAG: Protein of unknown function (DUF2442) [Candidatus Kentron sp. G]|nr:MAG: Protein of unknown function (DUF2442) [Candidatus Kentron sp. G]VFN07128.1 MAG: Protein of unknown function (DUF2442) [Candidatus Kentron sp. G]VFN07413.1 MAG: Protein of unknown function (DUF2442) [Candidatus Kentron sp. G]